MTPKDCGHHDHYCHCKKPYRRLIAFFLGLTVLILFTILLVFLTLRPTKPHFILLDTTVYAFNLSSSPNLLTSNFQVTLSSRNPDSRIGIFYEKLDVYAVYRGQQITVPTLIPSTYQGHKEVNVLSPFLYGNSVPVAPYLAKAFCQDQVEGTVLINIKVVGRVRWKVGTFVSRKYHLYVNCPAYMSFGNRNSGIPVGPAIKFQLLQTCHVDV